MRRPPAVRPRPGLKGLSAGAFRSTVPAPSDGAVQAAVGFDSVVVSKPVPLGGRRFAVVARAKKKRQYTLYVIAKRIPPKRYWRAAGRLPLLRAHDLTANPVCCGQPHVSFQLAAGDFDVDGRREVLVIAEHCQHSCALGRLRVTQLLLVNVEPGLSVALRAPLAVVGSKLAIESRHAFRRSADGGISLVLTAQRARPAPALAATVTLEHVRARDHFRLPAALGAGPLATLARRVPFDRASNPLVGPKPCLALGKPSDPAGKQPVFAVKIGSVWRPVTSELTLPIGCGRRAVRLRDVRRVIHDTEELDDDCRHARDDYRNTCRESAYLHTASKKLKCSQIHFKVTYDACGKAKTKRCTANSFYQRCGPPCNFSHGEPCRFGWIDPRLGSVLDLRSVPRL